MRKQTKVLAAAALFTLGASFSAFAAKTGTWVLEEDGWYCYDADGDAYEDEFCLSAGKEFYMGDDGLMVTSSWVEYDDEVYYVGSDGSKTIDAWRYVTPLDEEDEDEEWFYFGSKGKMVTGKKVIGEKTYYFDEDGKMLTGWVSYTVNGDTKVATDDVDADVDVETLVYCDENGARVASAWINTWAPGTDEDDQDEEDPYWYWIQSKGAPKVGKASDINGATYFFNEDAQMLTGWVKKVDDNEYVSFDGTISEDDHGTIFFCGNDDQGWVKKNRWIKTWTPAKFEEADDDNTQYWYWIAKNGEVYIPDEASNANAIKFVDGEDGAAALQFDGDAVSIAFNKVNDKQYAFKADGRMWSGLVKNTDDDNMYYFGGSNDGEMKTGSVMIEDEDGYEYKFFFGENDKYDYTKGAAVTGAAKKELYENGILVTSDKKYKEVSLDGENWYLIDEDGDIRTSKKVYKDEDDKLVLDATVSGFEFNDADGTLKGSYTK